MEAQINARLWVLNLSDGEHSLLDIAERSGQPFALIHEAAQTLRESGLLAIISETSRKTTQLEEESQENAADSCKQQSCGSSSLS
jgi:hypothetical protein